MKNLVLIVTALYLPVSAHAGSFNYDYLFVGAISTEARSPRGELDGQGGLVSGSLALHENLALGLDYDDSSFEHDIEAVKLSVGLVLHAPLSPDADLLLGGSVLNSRTKSPVSERDDTGYILSAGLRIRLTTRTQLNLKAAWTDVFDDPYSSLTAILVVGYNRQVSFTGGYQITEQSSTLGAGVGFSF